MDREMGAISGEGFVSGPRDGRRPMPPTGSERTAHAGVRGRPAEPSGMEAAMADRLGVGVPEWLRRLMCQRRPRSRDLVVLGVEMVSKPVQSRLEITLPCGTGHKLVSRC